MIGGVGFHHVSLLWLLIGVPPLLLLLIARERTRTRIARRFTSERLRGVPAAARLLRPWLITLASAAVVVAAAGPFAGYTLMPVTTRDANRVIAIDVSNSMAAEDVGTSRLSAARALAKRIIDAHDGRVALLVFESSADVVSPLTNDAEAVAALLETIDTGEVSQPGSDLAAAITASVRLVQADAAHRGDVVLISDGEDQGRRLGEVLGSMKGMSVPVSTIMIGSTAGSTIPANSGVLRSEDGSIVTTYARPELLEEIARVTGGRFFENPFRDRALEPLLQSSRGGAARETHVRVPIDRYQWPLALAFVLLLAGSAVNRGAE